MARYLRTGKQIRPKTATKGKRYLCAKCRKRSPRPVKTPAPWYCSKCAAPKKDDTDDIGLEPTSSASPSTDS